MPATTLAAIDLGSNSFHLIVTRVVDGQVRVVDRLKEMVQLAAGLDSQHRLSRAAQQRAFECLARFGQRLRDIPESRVRVVGTNTLRQLKSGKRFLNEARRLLGHPVEIVSGLEEARLIYLGVAHSLAQLNGRRLVIDIGGGSTELIVGEGFEPLHLDSLYMGCVSMTRAHFSGSRIKESALRQAELAVQVELEPVALTYRALDWTTAIGASGTIKAIRDIALANGWTHGPITLEAMEAVREGLLRAGSVATLARRWELSRARAQVLAGGFAILHSLFAALKLEQMEVSEGALREGVIHDLLGRIRHTDVREHTIATMSRRFGVDTAQAGRVRATAVALFAAAQPGWNLDAEVHGQQLDWAARLHELGLAIAHNHYHRHGAYILEHSDMPGFGREDQQFLASLVRAHRRKFPTDVLEALPTPWRAPAGHLCVLLRLAVVLHRSRSPEPLEPPLIEVTGACIRLEFAPGWLGEHPLTRADLQAEAGFLAAAGFELQFT